MLACRWPWVGSTEAGAHHDVHGAPLHPCPLVACPLNELDYISAGRMAVAADRAAGATATTVTGCIAAVTAAAGQRPSGAALTAVSGGGTRRTAGS